MTGELVWVFWTLGGLLGLVGLALAWWALFADRAKGRKRCPKCWYDMTGSPGLTCSECGYSPMCVAELFKTRRHWRDVGAAVFVLTCGGASGVTPTVRQDGWTSIVPTTALILLAPKEIKPNIGSLSLPWPGPNCDPVTAELSNRIIEDQLWVWQWKLLANRQHPKEDASWIVNVAMRSKWPMNEPLYGTFRTQRSLACMSWLGKSDLRIRVVPDLPDGRVWADERETLLALYNRGLIPRSCFFFGPIIWEDPCALLGTVPAGAESVTLDVTLERRNSADETSDWMLLWSGSIEKPIQVRGSLDEMFSPVETVDLQEILDQYSMEVSRHGVTLNASRAKTPTPRFNGVLAVRFELLRDGEVYAETEAWWASDTTRLFPNSWFVFGEQVPWPIRHDAAELRPSAAGEWSLRCIADPSLVLRNDDRVIDITAMERQFRKSGDPSGPILPGDYIQGTVTYPLRWSDAEQCWLAVH